MAPGLLEISDDIFMITLSFKFTPWHVNVFAIVKEGKIVLIDTGPNIPGILTALEDKLRRIGHEISDINHILITHSHPDHCGLAGAIQDISGAIVYMHEIEFNRLLVGEEAEFMSLRSFYRQGGLPKEIFARGGKTVKMWRDTILPLHEKKNLFLQGSTKIMDISFEAIICPGHSPGHAVFYIPERGILFSGDHVLPDITPNLSFDPVNSWFHPLRNFITSLDKIKGLPVSKVYPAHGRPFTNLFERVEAMKAHHTERKNLIMNALRAEAKTAYEISRDIFGINISDSDKLLAFNETYAHLIELESEQVIGREWLNGVSIFMPI